MTNLQGRFVDLSQPLMQGVEAWYDFSDGPTSAILTDKSHQGRHGTLVGGPVWTGDGLRFDGVNDVVNCAAPVSTIDGGLTVVGLFTMPEATVRYSRIVHLNDASNAVIGALRVGVAVENDRKVYWASGASTANGVSNEAFSAGSIVCGVGVHSGSSRTLYVNGAAQSGAFTDAVGGSGGLSMSIGARAGGSLFSTVLISLVTIHSRALSAGEVWELSQRLLSGTTDDLYEPILPRVFDMCLPR